MPINVARVHYAENTRSEELGRTIGITKCDDKEDWRNIRRASKRLAPQGKKEWSDMILITGFDKPWSECASPF
jgi:hypothetical protein